MLPASAVPEGWVAGRFSVLSPGTERRHLLGPGRDAGYMSLGLVDDGRWLLAPVPHGAAFTPDCPGMVRAPDGAPVQVAAVARFIQIALLGLDRLPPGSVADEAVVIGSGPVAVGCALELLRRGVKRIVVVTGRRYPPIRSVPGVVCTNHLDQQAGLVIDATGEPGRAVPLLAPGAVLGLLGTPENTASLPVLPLHRSGVTVVGMHELATSSPEAYQAAYTTAASWLDGRLTLRLVASWCRIVPGERAPEVYRLLNSPARPAEPFLLFDWGAS
ncbi:hypothetical protein [Streptomyces sodiiphilus]|uniref:hypothetical protein n=1 Tax=Streptomyces sodiiphilus TaxID=226217 RepID=UPI0031DAAD23